MTDDDVGQIGFLTEWQTYAQQVEGDEWRGEKMDKTKVDKMSGRSTVALTCTSCLDVAPDRTCYGEVCGIRD